MSFIIIPASYSFYCCCRPISADAGTTPNSFTFIAQTGMPLDTLIVSNTITVSGIDSAAVISISGGQYEINSDGWTSSAGTVNNGDTVTVAQMSSSSNSTLTSTTLTIGGVSGAFNVTTAHRVIPMQADLLHGGVPRTMPMTVWAAIMARR